jgi:hypothetical protein
MRHAVSPAAMPCNAPSQRFYLRRQGDNLAQAEFVCGRSNAHEIVLVLPALDR